MDDDPLALAAFEALNWFRETMGFSHAGTVERHNRNVLIWGLNHPDPLILMFNIEDNEWTPLTRELWESLTHMSPPWPWNDEGTGMDYAKDHGVPIWWEGMIEDFKERQDK